MGLGKETAKKLWAASWEGGLEASTAPGISNYRVGCSERQPAALANGTQGCLPRSTQGAA